MGGWLSDEERERIENFVTTPRYDRTPDQLCPPDGECEDD